MRQKPELATLSAKQARFVEEYLVDLNGTQAAIRSGYSARTAHAKANELLKHPVVGLEIKRRREELSAGLKITQERVLEEYARIAFLDIRKAYDDAGNLRPINEIDEDTARAIAGLDVVELWEGRGDEREQVGVVKKMKLADKKGALDSLARHLGMFVDKTEVTGGDGQPFTIKIVRGLGE